MKTKQRQKSTFKLIETKTFSESSFNEAINHLTYGFKVTKYHSNGRKQNRIYYIFEDDPLYLQYIHPSKSYPDCRIPLSSITEIREQATSENLKHLAKDKSLQITFKNQKHVFEFESRRVRDLCWQGIQFFIEKQQKEQELTKKDLISQLGKKLFFTADVDGSKELNFQEVKNIIKSIHLNIPDEQLISLFHQYDQDSSSSICFEEFLKLLKQIMTYEELKPIFIKFASHLRGSKIFKDDEPFMCKSDFHHFLCEIQNEKLTPSQLHDLFYSYATLSCQHNNQYLMNFQQFTTYLLSESNSAYDMDQLHDMDQPLTNYYINSSHNTYLMSNQLTGESSIQGYINAIQKGCKCVELDCWDGPNNCPIIYHGYTMTSKITFESVIQTLKQYSFKYSPYPMILSLEVHCSISQQQEMANIMNKYFGDSIYLVPDNYNSLEIFPSPEDLKYKFILKGKGQPWLSVNYRSGQQFDSDRTFNYMNKLKNDSNEELKEIIETESEVKSIHSSSSQVSLKPKYKIILESNTEKYNYLPNPRANFQTQKPDDIDDEILEDKEAKVKDAVTLVAITSMFGIPIKFNQPRSVFHISSLDEQKIENFYQKDPAQIIYFNAFHFTRIYPSGSRVDSSNYDPITAFNAGSHLVALNFQTIDLPLLINYCKFLQNQQSGYVLKPDYMRQPIAKRKIHQMTLNLHVICGQNLKPAINNKDDDIVDPFVRITLRGHPLDEEQNPPKRSKTIENNGLNPKFDFGFTAHIQYPELAMIVIEVIDEDLVSNDFIGWTAIPALNIKRGYRVVHLLDNYLNDINHSNLFIHV